MLYERTKRRSRSLKSYKVDNCKVSFLFCEGRRDRKDPAGGLSPSFFGGRH